MFARLKFAKSDFRFDQDPNFLGIFDSGVYILLLIWINHNYQMIEEKSSSHSGSKNQIISTSQKNKLESLKHSYSSSQKVLKDRNIFQKLFFTHVSPILSYGYSFDLTQDDIPKLHSSDCPTREFQSFKSIFERQKESETKEGKALLKSLYLTFRRQFIVATLIAAFVIMLEFTTPILTDRIINYVQNKSSGNNTVQTGLLYFFGLLISNFLYNISLSQMFNRFNKYGYNLKLVLSSIIYDKAIRFPLITQKQFGASDIINYSQVDAQRFTFIGFQLISAFLFPIQIVFIFMLLYFYIGISFLVGIGIMVIIMIFTVFLTRYLGNVNDELLKKKDGRMKVTEEVMQIIKFIKINALQGFFLQKLDEKRQLELKELKKNNYTIVCLIFIYWVSPFIIVAATFLTFSHLGNQITPSIAFVVIILFNILQFPLMYLPSSLIQLVQIWASVKRIQHFLRAKELQWGHIKISSDKSTENAIEIKNGTFLWGKETKKEEKQGDEKKKNKKKKIDQKEEMKTQEALRESLISEEEQIRSETKEQGKQVYTQVYTKTLTNINYNFSKGKLTMIIGDIGSGKSSLLYSILNEMTPSPQDAPQIVINGRIAYVPQKPWIMSGTLKSNIMFNEPFDQKRMEQAIKYSCLQDDIKLLGQGLETEIGQKGVNLSGGQKTRVALARAIYSNRQIYLLDDVISAVDVNVGKFIIEETIRKYLKGKTVIMPTHAIHYLKNADEIIIMQKGQIAVHGPYDVICQAEQFAEIDEIQRKKVSELKKNKSKEDERIIEQQKMVAEELQKISHRKVSQQEEEENEKLLEKLILPEEHEKGRVSFSMYKAYVKLNGGWIFAFGILTSLALWTILSILSNIEIEQWCNDPSNSSNHLYLYLGFGVSGAIFTSIRSLFLVGGGIRQSKIIHNQMIISLLYASIIKLYNRVPLGRILNRLSKDLKQIDEALGNAVGDFLSFLFKLVGTIVMCLYASSPYILIPTCFFLVFCMKLQNYYLKTQRQCVRLQAISSSPIVSGFTSAVNGAPTIRAYNSGRFFLEQQMERIDINKRNNFTKITLQNWFAFRLSLLSCIVNMSAIGYGIFSDNDNGSLVGLLLAYSIGLDQDLINAVFTYAFLETKMISIERVLQFTEIDAEKGYEQEKKKARSKFHYEQDEAINSGDIQFINFSARYRNDLPIILKNVTLKINEGEKIGIVGRTGAGKSTLLSCLIRLLDPCEGQIRIGNKNLLEYPLQKIRSSFTVIEQEPTLILGSFKQNLDPSNFYSEKQLKQHLEECNLWNLVQEKGGLHAILSNESLSAGEKQLLCISRAFLKNSKIVLIDEATANIDVKSDEHIQNLIQNKFEKSTVLTIAHRLSTLKCVDKILVLGDGKVLEWGKRVDLLNSDSIYRSMCQKNDKSYFE